ncbi:KilA-N domain-containing protein, partial [Escherichia coli]
MQQTFNADMNISNLHQNVDPSTTLPVICGVEITTDRAGRYNLNALHRASGLGAHKAPAQWLRTLSAKQLIEELEKETMQNCIVSFEGRGGGTFA